MQINTYFILLNTFLGIIALFNIVFKLNAKYDEYSIIILLVLAINLIFYTSNIFNFYILFEITLPLLFILIAIYGSSFRIKASYYIFLYTLFGSLFLLLGIIFYNQVTGNLYLNIMVLKPLSNINLELIVYMLIFAGFLVKIPMFPTHIWLSYAHSEAPVSGSVMLAGIVLKLAVYGIIIMLINLLPNAHLLASLYISWLAVFTLFYITAITMIQTDTKVIVAYSSVAHMAIVVLGLFSNNVFGIIGAIILSLAHGLASPALFLLVGDYIYKIYHTRYLNIVRGLVQYAPILSVFLFLFSLCNISFPLTLNFTGEFLCLSSLTSNALLLTLSCFTILFSSLITFNLLTKVIFRDSFIINPGYIITISQFNLLFTLLIPLLVLGVFSSDLYTNIGLNSLDLTI